MVLMRSLELEDGPSIGDLRFEESQRTAWTHYRYDDNFLSYG